MIERYFIDDKLYGYTYDKESNKTIGIREKKKSRINNTLRKLLRTDKYKGYKVANSDYIILVSETKKLVINNKLHKVTDMELKFIKKSKVSNIIRKCKNISFIYNKNNVRNGALFLSGVAIVFLMGREISKPTNEPTTDVVYDPYSVEENITYEPTYLPDDTITPESIDNGIITGESLLEVSNEEEALNEELNSDVVSNESIASTTSSENSYDVFAEVRNTELGSYIEKYSAMFGLDSNLLYAIGHQESRFNHYDNIPGGSGFNGYGIGVMQVENVQIGSDISANDAGGNKVSITVDENTLTNMESNVMVASMMLKSYIDRYQGNVMLAIHAYNAGSGTVGLVCSEMSYQTYGEVTQETVNAIYRESINNSEMLNTIKNDLVSFGVNPMMYIESISDDAKESNPNMVSSFCNRETSHAHPTYVDEVLAKLPGSVNNNGVIFNLEIIEETDNLVH